MLIEAPPDQSVDEITIDPSALAAETGWEAKPEGLCKDVRCVPAADAVRADGTLGLASVAERLRMPIVSDPERGLHALGPEGDGRALASATMPDLVLPDADGNPFDLGSLQGRKVLLVAWASW